MSVLLRFRTIANGNDDAVSAREKSSPEFVEFTMLGDEMPAGVSVIPVILQVACVLAFLAHPSHLLQ